jgi:hypothetical protein
MKIAMAKVTVTWDRRNIMYLKARRLDKVGEA